MKRLSILKIAILSATTISAIVLAIIDLSGNYPFCVGLVLLGYIVVLLINRLETSEQGKNYNREK